MLHTFITYLKISYCDIVNQDLEMIEAASQITWNTIHEHLLFNMNYKIELEYK